MKSYKEFINESNEIDRDELNSIIDPIRDDILDMLVDFVGYDIKFIPVNMLDSTRYVQDRIPKIEVYIIGEDELFDHNYTDVVFPVIEDIKRYVTGLGFSTNGHFTDGYPGWSGGWSPYRAYKLLIQK